MMISNTSASSTICGWDVLWQQTRIPGTNKLPEEYQAILKEQAVAAAKYSFDTIAADNEVATQTLKDAGVEFDENPDIQSFKDKLGGEEYYQRYAEESWFNQEILDKILAY